MHMQSESEIWKIGTKVLAPLETQTEPDFGTELGKTENLRKPMENCNVV